MRTDAGSCDVNITLDARRHFRANISATGIALGTLVSESRLGNLSTVINLSGSLPKGGSPTVEANGVVSRLAYNGYTYNNVTFRGSYARNTVTGNLSINDPNISLTAGGQFGSHGRDKQLVVEARLDNFRPSATRLSDKWGDAVFSGCEFQDVLLVLVSVFGYAMLTGHFNYSTLLSSITSQLGRHIPVISPEVKASKGKTTGGDNNFTLMAHINSTKWMQPLLGIPLDIRRPLLLRSSVTAAHQSMIVECEAPSFTYDGKTFRTATVFGHSSTSTRVAMPPTTLLTCRSTGSTRARTAAVSMPPRRLAPPPRVSTMPMSW